MSEPAFDYLARRFDEVGEPHMQLAALLADAEETGFNLDDVSLKAIRQALHLRSLKLERGIVMREEPQNLNPVKTDFEEFVSEAERIIREAIQPVDTIELLSQIEMSHDAIPLASIKTCLRDVGLHYIPGAGYWTHPQYTDQAGRIVTRRCRSERLEKLIECFEQHGYPMTALDIEKWTDGMAPRHWAVRYATSSGGAPIIKGIGAGLYVPVDKLDTAKIPMSYNMAAAINDLTPDQVLNNKDHLRLFKVALLLGKHGYADVHTSRTSRGNVRCQTARVELNEKGRRMVRKAMRDTTDEF